MSYLSCLSWKYLLNNVECISGQAAPWRGGPLLLPLALRWVGHFICHRKTNLCCRWTRSPRGSVKSWWLIRPAREPEDKGVAKVNKDKFKAHLEKEETERREIGNLWQTTQPTNSSPLFAFSFPKEVCRTFRLMTPEEKPGWRSARSTFNLLYYPFSVSFYEGGTRDDTLVQNQPFIIVFLSKCSQQVSSLKFIQIEMAETSLPSI